MLSTRLALHAISEKLKSHLNNGLLLLLLIMLLLLLWVCRQWLACILCQINYTGLCWAEGLGKVISAAAIILSTATSRLCTTAPTGPHFLASGLFWGDNDFVGERILHL